MKQQQQEQKQNGAGEHDAADLENQVVAGGHDAGALETPLDAGGHDTADVGNSLDAGGHDTGTVANQVVDLALGVSLGRTCRLRNICYQEKHPGSERAASQNPEERGRGAFPLNGDDRDTKTTN